jgi:anaphase-promoting complex subunit 2
MVHTLHPANWQFDDLVKAVGSLNRGVVIKALATWVDLGVLKEEPENAFVLLEREEQVPASGVVRDHPRLG